MTLPFWCLFVATLFIVLSKVPMNVLGARQEPFDNHHPRLQQHRLTGAAHRAWAAHQNMLEAYPPFVAAVVVSHLGGAPELVATAGCSMFLAARLSYQFCYLADYPTARSLSWGFGYIGILMVFLSPLLA